MVVASTVIGSAWPALVYHFREAPSAAKVDLERDRPQPEGHPRRLRPRRRRHDGPVRLVERQAEQRRRWSSWPSTTAQMSVIDPNQLSPTFNVEQQLQAYYGFKSTLDTGHYDHQRPVAGRRPRRTRAASQRHPPVELGQQPSRLHARVRRRRRADHRGRSRRPQSPVFLDGGMPPGQQIPVTRPQIYFGQAFGSSSYSIVGQPAGSTREAGVRPPGRQRLVDVGTTRPIRATAASRSARPCVGCCSRSRCTTRTSSSAPSSTAPRSCSTVRNPRARVAKVAPWLTLDGDVYPAVVNGQHRVDRRRLHHVVELSRLAAGQPAHGQPRPR